ncbi:adenylate/guanylate cyclase domain-containing protein [Arsenicicoccus dermatophilus]|uniref:adenylate/guanylate cyclase domain-containing protein n=1 Tax=Arsenicicoccus dermatophilus TaxID=1076331 RepID=UPI001F4CFEDD|nr:adenylate/guanylate cyclase domain-containing protein [Arsenicicoccus dermatophilus]MCH8614317.1 adenylate/guanylate cyclase domain-containing protein [Arsenicicoccus dermatophilus]
MRVGLAHGKLVCRSAVFGDTVNRAARLTAEMVTCGKVLGDQVAVPGRASRARAADRTATHPHPARRRGGDPSLLQRAVPASTLDALRLAEVVTLGGDGTALHRADRPARPRAGRRARQEPRR